MRKFSILLFDFYQLPESDCPLPQRRPLQPPRPQSDVVLWIRGKVVIYHFFLLLLVVSVAPVESVVNLLYPFPQPTCYVSRILFFYAPLAAPFSTHFFFSTISWRLLPDNPVDDVLYVSVSRYFLDCPSHLILSHPIPFFISTSPNPPYAEETPPLSCPRLYLPLPWS